MSLNITGNTLRFENINHPNDIYLYFSGGHYVWNYNDDAPLYIWFQGDMFTLRKEIPKSELLSKLRVWIWNQTPPELHDIFWKDDGYN